MNLIYFILILIVVTCSGRSLTDQFEDDRIVGGITTDISIRPYQISLRKRAIDKPNNPFSHTCGGSVLDENIIITAAHCVISLIASQLHVMAGTNYGTGTSGVISPVREIIFHADYNPSNFRNDIALLVLHTPLPINNFSIKSIKLTDREYSAGTNAIVSGWGTENWLAGNLPYELREVTLPIIDLEDCKKDYKRVFQNVYEEMICAGLRNQGGKDACQGDSGGPLVVDNKLVGVVSWGIGCALRNFPGVFTNVNYFLPWLEEKITDIKIRYNFS